MRNAIEVGDKVTHLQYACWYDIKCNSYVKGGCDIGGVRRGDIYFWDFKWMGFEADDIY